MVGWRGRSLRGTRLSPAARAWEHAKLQELGLEDVVWDHGAWCPRCRAALKRQARKQAQSERLPVDKGTEEKPPRASARPRAAALPASPPAWPAPGDASPPPTDRDARRSRRKRRA